jgi:DNA invertase Pin-like site-specific DNA recombinase
MLIGYARVSTTDLKFDLQHDALAKAGCEKVFEDKLSGARDDRPGLRNALSHCRPGDVLVAYKLDRLGRTMRGLVALVADLAQRKIEFRSLSDGIDTTTTMGRFTFHLLGALAEMERDLIRERTNAGLAAARAQGPQRRPQGHPDATEARRRQGSLRGPQPQCRRGGETAWRRPHHALPRARKVRSGGGRDRA